MCLIYFVGQSCVVWDSGLVDYVNNVMTPLVPGRTRVVCCHIEIVGKILKIKQSDNEAGTWVARYRTS